MKCATWGVLMFDMRIILLTLLECVEIVEMQFISHTIKGGFAIINSLLLYFKSGSSVLRIASSYTCIEKTVVSFNGQFELVQV